jgi:tRNA 2-thiocytidine biosynthesis protein TtcA
MSEPYVPAAYLAKLWRAVIEFNMLAPGDKILIGLSGGKDSMFLTAALAELQKHAPFPFELACYTVDTMFSKDFPKKELEDFCARLQLKHYSEPVDVLKLWQHRGNTPCFTCAYFRRAATNRKANELGFNKVAWAHHHDDAVDTLVLNLFTSGQLKTFLPVTYLSRSKITLIRPLLYYREAEIIKMVHELGFTPIKNPCEYNGYTQRQAVKEILPLLDKKFPGIYDHLGSVMREWDGTELWPAKLSQKELVDKFNAFWKLKTKK